MVWMPVAVVAEALQVILNLETYDGAGDCRHYRYYRIYIYELIWINFKSIIWY